jgi:hypothetical protein
MTRVGVCLAALLASAIIAGCGGGNAPTKDEFIASATPICKDAEQSVKDAEGGSQKQFLATFAAAAHSAHDGLAGLDLPDQDRDLIESYIADLARIADDLDAAAVALTEGNSDVAKAKSNAAFSLFEKTSKNTKDFGFPKGVCGSGES